MCTDEKNHNGKYLLKVSYLDILWIMLAFEVNQTLFLAFYSFIIWTGQWRDDREVFG